MGLFEPEQLVSRTQKRALLSPHDRGGELLPTKDYNWL